MQQAQAIRQGKRDRAQWRRFALAWALLLCAWSATSGQVTTTPDAPTASTATAPGPVADSTPVAEKSATKGSAAPDARVHFYSDVQPIIFAHCVKCHGPNMTSGGLRLETREFALQGGDSGKPILGGKPDDNELLARVASTERNYRMPKNAPALAPEEIETIRRWVEMGAGWPAPSNTISEQTLPFYYRWTLALGGVAEDYKAELEYLKPFAIGFLVLQLGMLFVLRSRTAYRAGRSWSRGKLAAWCALCDRFSRGELLLAWLLCLTAFGLIAARGHVVRLDQELAVHAKAKLKKDSVWIRTAYGYPPKPLRPDHPKRLAGTYYRGNCERNENLFNRGNYLTSTFEVSLCDQDHRPLIVGSPLPPEGVFLRLEIIRAPGTTPLLFSKELMASVALSSEFIESDKHAITQPLVRLETLEPEQRWVAYVPLGLPKGDRMDGVVYVYTGRLKGERFLGHPHYGVGYTLVQEQGKLTADSEVYMDSFGNTAFAEESPPGRLPYNEWFTHRPLPVIEGENSTDPKLLGVEQYVNEGLIAPPDKNPADKTPPDNADPQPASEQPKQAPEPAPQTTPSGEASSAGSTSAGAP